MFWKKGIEYRGVSPFGDKTRWEVARARPRVTNSRAREGGVEIIKVASC